MKRIKCVLSIILAGLFLTACEGDVSFGGNNRTADIEVGMAERSALSLMQATLFAHKNSAIYDFLDASDFALSIGATSATEACFGTNYIENIPGDGDITFSDPRNPNIEVMLEPGEKYFHVYRSGVGVDQPAEGEKYRVGDRIFVVYNQCQDDQGVVYNGSLSGVYTELSGLNDRFVEITTEQCMDAVASDFSINTTPISFTGESVYYVPDAGELRLTIDGDETDSLVGRNESHIIVVNSGVGAGDKVYTLIGEDMRQQRCQAYERKLSVSFNNFSSQIGTFTSTYNGNVELVEGSFDLENYEQEIRDSSFTVTVQQNNLVETYNMTGFRITQGISQIEGSYAYTLSGEVSSSAIGGVVELSVNDGADVLGLLGSDYPTKGTMLISGRDLEAIQVVVNQSNIAINVSANGDTTGDERSDFDSENTIFTTWAQFFNRDFLRDE